MTITEETIEQLKAPNGQFKMHIVRKMRRLSGFRKWRTHIIGVEVEEDFIKALVEYAKTDNFRAPGRECKGRTKIPKKLSTSRARTIKVDTKERADTRIFVKQYVENMSNDSIYGGLVPIWIHSSVQWDIVRMRLMKLPYSAFLKTYYWRAIAMYMKHKNGDHCTYCPAETGLQVHHKTYDHHGIELFYMDELEVVCDKCHKARH